MNRIHCLLTTPLTHLLPLIVPFFIRTSLETWSWPSLVRDSWETLLPRRLINPPIFKITVSYTQALGC